MSDLIIRPGDVLLLGMDGTLTAEQAVRIKDALMKSMPGLADLILITRCPGAIAVYRAPSAPRPPVPTERLP